MHKTRKNEDYINDETEQLFTLISETIVDLERVMNKRKFINKKLKTKNETE